MCLLANGAFQKPGPVALTLLSLLALSSSFLCLAAVNAGGIHLLPDLILEVVAVVVVVVVVLVAVSSGGSNGWVVVVMVQ
jgi:hypothetical protein